MTVKKEVRSVWKLYFKALSLSLRGGGGNSLVKKPTVDWQGYDIAVSKSTCDNINILIL